MRCFELFRVRVIVVVGIAWGGRVGVCMRVCMRFRIRRCRCTTEQGGGLHFVVVLLLRGRHVAFRCLDRRERIAEQLRVDAEYERRIDGLARAADLGRELVQGVEVVQDVVERAL